MASVIPSRVLRKMLKCIKMTPLQLHHNSTVYITLSLSVMKNNSVYFSYQEFLRRQFQPIANFRIKTFLRCEEHVVLLLNSVSVSWSGASGSQGWTDRCWRGGEEVGAVPAVAESGHSWQSVSESRARYFTFHQTFPPSLLCLGWDLNCFDI